MRVRSFLVLVLFLLAVPAWAQPTDELTRVDQEVGRLFRAGQYQEALPLAQRALAMAEQLHGAEDPLTARSANSLAAVYAATADYTLAEALYLRVLRIHERVFGPSHVKTSITLNNLAELYRMLEDYERAVPLYRRALAIYEKERGAQAPGTAIILDNLAATYADMGAYAQAEPLFLRALRIQEAVQGPEHRDTTTTLVNLAGLYRQMGDYGRAEPLYLRALATDEKVLGPRHPDTALDLNNLGLLYSYTRDNARAEEMLKRALAIREEVLGPDHPSTAVTLNNLGALYSAMGDFPHAEAAYKRALDVKMRTLGAEHPSTATSMSNLAHLYQGMGDVAHAEPHWRQAVAVYEKVHGDTHPSTTSSRGSLAFLLHEAGHADEALALGIRASAGREAALANVLSFTSERQRLAYQGTTRPYDLFATLGAAPQLAQAVLRWKGIVLDSLLEDVAMGAGAGDPRLARMRTLKQQLLQLVLGRARDTSAEALERRAALQREVESLEGELARSLTGLGRARRSLTVTPAQVQAALPVGAVLIEYVRYARYLGKDAWRSCYGAVVFSRDGAPAWVPLGDAVEIEALVDRCRREIVNFRQPARRDERFSRILRDLHDRLWTPLQRRFPAGTRTVIVSPDAQLSFVSFATLLGEDGAFLASRYDLRYVASGRDLLLSPTSGPSREMVVVADPTFDAVAAAGSTGDDALAASLQRSTVGSELRGQSFAPLPGTADESRMLATIARDAGWKLRLLVGDDASESALRAVASPLVLHVATHGWFLAEIALGRSGEGRPASLGSPMLRSGLALTGANGTVEAWSRGDVPPPEGDGMLMASEVGGMDLRGTWLVVLSACETARGKARAGEGVMGLRRAFVQAGARHLLMTLWSISDDATPPILRDFYGEAVAGGDPPRALAHAQRTWLERLRRERGVLAAVQIAGPFIVSSQGAVR